MSSLTPAMPQLMPTPGLPSHRGHLGEECPLAPWPIPTSTPVILLGCSQHSVSCPTPSPAGILPRWPQQGIIQDSLASICFSSSHPIRVPRPISASAQAILPEKPQRRVLQEHLASACFSSSQATRVALA